MTLPQRRLGHLSVSALGLGCMGMSEFYGTTNELENIQTLDHALELGVTLFDTADMYGSGQNEKLLGAWLQNKRQQVILATKFGILRDPANPHSRNLNGRPEYVYQAIEASLKRLRTDYIDLYYLHRVDPNVPIEDTVGAMGELVAQGKVRHLGLSEVSSENLRRAHSVHPITALQSEYSLWTREPEKSILAVCRELGIGFVPFSPLGRGFLTGQIRSAAELDADDNRRNHPRFQGENLERNLMLVKEVENLAKLKACTPAQVALAWVLAQGDDIVPIPGTRKTKRLEENIGALKVQLTQDELDALNRVFQPDTVSGARHPNIQLNKG